MDVAKQHRDFSVTKKWLGMSPTLFPLCSPYNISSAPVGGLQPPCTMDIYEIPSWDFQETNSSFTIVSTCNLFRNSLSTETWAEIRGKMALCEIR